ncbi:hypothetical protein D5041_08305 [Verminephrobacter aporrectodeae subsp. tuberculatae]|uniref:hypothetical protein n=1 Tax=Verminephrobacter aporrectodeae TaxID=1110389 RepID=UPI00023757E0|nr:hypothetical protein [Verminephrobacter aporrectodeae]MCW5223594.1 hypothetical protein [Verminephrobacter aporrectodeae subsp. tuberculatae]MCW5256244.1 hypothetical protein [Verminephrobacter aporrectodeae subsp. tuberculatae]MCW5289059.1 hypothetical protein [Verminephrobacter aporrectodeae subsp. tuberculatae]
METGIQWTAEATLRALRLGVCRGGRSARAKAATMEKAIFTGFGTLRKQTRKPDGQHLVACPPGLTADTTVFAIARNAEMNGPHGAEARYCPQGFAMEAASAAPWH